MSAALTISERIRRQDAPTLPPRFAAFALYEGEDAACLGRNDDPELLLALAGNELAELGYERELVAVVDRDGKVADIYEQIVHTRNDGTQVVREPAFVRTAKWCCACEAIEHTIAECVDEDPHAGEPEESVAESLGGWR